MKRRLALSLLAAFGLAIGSFPARSQNAEVIVRLDGERATVDVSAQIAVNRRIAWAAARQWSLEASTTSSGTGPGVRVNTSAPGARALSSGLRVPGGSSFFRSSQLILHSAVVRYPVA